MNVPVAVGVPLIVTTLPAQLPVTPGGRPAKVAPVAPVVAYLIVVAAVFTQTVCASVPAAELSAIVLSGVTVTVSVAVVAHWPAVGVNV